MQQSECHEHMSRPAPPDRVRRPPAAHASATGLRRVAEAAVTPLELDDVLDVFHPLRAGAELRGRIVSVTAETAEPPPS